MESDVKQKKCSFKPSGSKNRSKNITGISFHSFLENLCNYSVRNQKHFKPAFTIISIFLNISWFFGIFSQLLRDIVKGPSSHFHP